LIVNLTSAPGSEWPARSSLFERDNRVDPPRDELCAGMVLSLRRQVRRPLPKR